MLDAIRIKKWVIKACDCDLGRKSKYSKKICQAFSLDYIIIGLTTTLMKQLLSQ